MVSSLYKADEFYKLQKKGKIASVYVSDKKLKKDGKGFFVNRKNSQGEMFRQRVKDDDLVYTRAETGVTKYSPARDKDLTNPDTLIYGSRKKWSKKAHTGDYLTTTGKIMKR
jgi:hypothetical protein